MSSERESLPPGPSEGMEGGTRTGLRALVRDMLTLNRPALVILVTVPFMLTLLEFYGLPWHYNRQFETSSYRPVREMTTDDPRTPDIAKLFGGLEMPGPEKVRPYLWWVAACLLLLVAIPMLVGGWIGRLSPRALGLRIKGTGRDAWTYLLLFVIFFPVVWLVSLTPDFQATYPFYKPGNEGLGYDFLLFEIVYCLQFFAIEFFFRGFMVLGLKRHIGWASVLVMIAPYCMIHYYKPLPEALGAIGAGLVLGVLSYRTGTILYGWALHFAVALSMDLLALSHLGLL